MQITKAIIPVAGFGTRFLPVTKALPKEMLPIVDKPVVQYIVEDLVKSGITDIIFVTGQNKRAIEDHFDYHPELESWLKAAGKTEQLEQIREVAALANFVYIRQKGPYGNGTPVLNAAHLVGSEPFVVIWGDDLYRGGEKPHVQALIETYRKYESPVLTAIDIDDEETKQFAVIDGEEVESGIYRVDKIVEKPGPRAKSRIGVLGAYILTPDIFEELENTAVRKGELWLVDAISKLSRKREIYAKKTESQFFDTGSKIGWFEANISIGLEHPEIKNELKKLLRSYNV